MHAQCRLNHTEGKLVMDYKILPGQVSKSYGIDLAESIKFPKDVVDKARKFAEGLEKFEDELVSSQKKMQVEKNENTLDGYSISYETKLKIISLVNDIKEQYGEYIPEEARREVQVKIRQFVGATK